jgi:hypothetical protein
LSSGRPADGAHKGIRGLSLGITDRAKTMIDLFVDVYKLNKSNHEQSTDDR